MQPIKWAFITNSSCPALCRASTSWLHSSKKDVDGRDKPGHDEGAIGGSAERNPPFTDHKKADYAFG